MQLPTIHLNGSHGPTLLDGYRKAIEALNTAMEAVAQTGPHGRDYYFPGQSITVAMEEHSARLQRLAEVMRELETIGVHVMDEIDDATTEAKRELETLRNADAQR